MRLLTRFYGMYIIMYTCIHVHRLYIKGGLYVIYSTEATGQGDVYIQHCTMFVSILANEIASWEVTNIPPRQGSP